MAYARHNLHGSRTKESDDRQQSSRGEDDYDVKPFPGYHQRGAEQFKGTPEDDNYRQVGGRKNKKHFFLIFLIILSISTCTLIFYFYIWYLSIYHEDFPIIQEIMVNHFT